MNDETTGRDGGVPMSRREAIALTAGSAAMLLVAKPAGAGTVEAEEARRFDAVVVGGGPAGLSAALNLGRACRRVLVVDAGPGRNAPAEAVHGFLSRDGTSPSELRRIGREQLKPYAVEVRTGSVTDARKVEGGFEVTLDGAGSLACRTLILATGVQDELPDLPGVKEWWGNGAVGCPYCHGWEVRDRPWAFTGPPEGAVEKATLLLGWTKSLTYLSNGPAGLTEGQRKWLADRKVGVREEKVAGLDGRDGKLAAVVFEGGGRLEVAAVFVHATLGQRSDLPKRLGCKFVTSGWLAGTVETDPSGATGVPGLFVIGDASAAGVLNVAGAVADGTAAAGAANMAMLKQDAG